MKPCVQVIALLLLAVGARADFVDEIVRKSMETQKIPGLSLAVVKDGKIIRAQGYGFANLEWKVRARPDTNYQIGSVTKCFTATGIMILVEEGKLRLEDTLGSLLPASPAGWHPVTVRQLLNHTSGVPGDTETPAMKAMMTPEFRPMQTLVAHRNAKLEFAPGSRWDYSNHGYYLLGLIIEKVSGKGYDEFLTERIFRPLEMKSTRMNDLHMVMPNRASGYLYSGNRYGNSENVPPGLSYAAGALVSTVQDLARWDIAWAQGRLLRPESVATMWSPSSLTNGATHPYGLGWVTESVGGVRRVYHTGGIPCFSSIHLRYPDQGVSVILLCNQLTGLGGLATAIANHYLPVPSNTKRVTFRLPGYSAATQAALAGDFNSWGFTPMKRRGADWTVEIRMTPGVQRYKFVVDGVWLVDPTNPKTETDAQGNVNSVVEVK